MSRNLVNAHLNRVRLGPALEEEKIQIVGDALRFQSALMQIALAFNFLEPVRAAMETSQCLLQAIPTGGSPLLQLPGVDKALAADLALREKNPIRNIQSLLRMDEKERRKALEILDSKTYSQAMNIAKQIPILVLSNVHFKGTTLNSRLLTKVPGDKIVTPGAIVQLVFTTRLATEKDYLPTATKPDVLGDSSSDDSDIEDDVDVLIGRKRSYNDGEPTPIALAHAPYFPQVQPIAYRPDMRNTNRGGGHF